MTTRIVLAEDHRMVAEALTTMLSMEESMQVVATTASGVEVVDLVAEHQPDIVLVDIALRERDGISATREMVAQNANVRVLILSMHDDADTVTEALASGAKGFVPKNGGRNALIKAIESIAAGQGYLDPSVTGVFLERIGPVATAALQANQLTAQEHRVLEAVADGRTTKEVATDLGVSPETIKTHLRHIYQKLGVDDRVEAVAVAVRTGLIQ